MNVGYHHQVPSVFDGPGRVLVPGHFGMFIAELAQQAGMVTYYTHEGPPSGIEDFVLPPDRVRCINLGPERRAPIALLRPAGILRRIDAVRDGVDVFLARGPGPLVPSIVRRSSVPAAALIVGDYRSWSPNVANPGWRNQLIRTYRWLYGRLQERALRDALTMTQNRWLLEHASGSPFACGRVVFTSSVTDDMIRAIDARRPTRREDRGGRWRILYTGRIVEEKGVMLIVEAVARLVARGFDVELELVGWAPTADPTPRLVEGSAAEHGIADRVRLVGFASAADAIIDRYLDADIFVFASPTEWGSSHTITEAMVARLPVVTTSFEGIRGELRDGEHVVLVEPRSAEAIAVGIARVIEDDALRDRLERNGRLWAEERTNERSVAEVVRALRELVPVGTR